MNDGEKSYNYENPYASGVKNIQIAQNDAVRESGPQFVNIFQKETEDLRNSLDLKPK